MGKKLSGGSKQVTLFDIRLQNLDRDVLVLKGRENEAASTLIAGKVALSINEPLSFKKISLKLYCSLHVEGTDGTSSNHRITKFEKRLFEHYWDNLTTDIKCGGGFAQSSLSFGVGHSPNQSSTSLKSLGTSIRSLSGTNLSGSVFAHGHGHHEASSTNISSKGLFLPEGNYEFPFDAILPGDMPESVEGLPRTLVVYKLLAVLDRGKFHNNLKSGKRLRVVRTLATDAIELSETVAVDNTWPQKVEYSLNVPSKAIAIGSSIPVSLMFVPLVKGLKIGDIKIELVEYYSVMGYYPPPLTGERIVSRKTVSRHREEEAELATDKWEHELHLRVPANLSKCTQDCDIQNYIKVRHKLKFVVGIVNPDGHVSELRASLPVQLFISPFIALRGSPEKPDTDSTKHSGSAEDVTNDEEIIFEADSSLQHARSLSGSPAAESQHRGNGELQGSHQSSCSSFNGLMAPPVYENHIYDRLWSDVSPIDSPMSSGLSTPRNEGGELSDDIQSEFSMNPLDSAQLNETLRQLNLQRQAQEITERLASSSGRDRATFNIGENPSHGTESNASPGDYLTKGRQISPNYSNSCFLSSIDVGSPPVHISRVNSDNLDSTTLSRVPSYHQAVSSDARDELLSPAYEPPLPGSNINLAEVNQRFEAVNHPRPEPVTTNSRSIRSKLDMGRVSSNLNLKSLSATSMSSSSNSSPSASRSESLTSLNSLSRSPSKRLSHNHLPSMSSNPVPFFNSQNNSTSSHGYGRSKPTDIPPVSLPSASGTSITKPSSSASDRSAALLGAKLPSNSGSSLSLHNLHFLHKKTSREKK